jgi:hypothetical protein
MILRSLAVSGVLARLAQAAVITNEPLITPAPVVRRDQIDPGSWSTSTCGYVDGDPKQARLAASPFACRADTQWSIWGFCLATETVVSHCGLAGACVDSHACSKGCGLTGKPVTTWTWYVSPSNLAIGESNMSLVLEAVHLSARRPC